MPEKEAAKIRKIMQIEDDDEEQEEEKETNRKKRKKRGTEEEEEEGKRRKKKMMMRKTITKTSKSATTSITPKAAITSIASKAATTSATARAKAQKREKMKKETRVKKAPIDKSDPNWCLKPNPNVAVWDKDPMFESRDVESTLPFVSSTSHSRIVIAAALTKGNSNNLKP